MANMNELLELVALSEAEINCDGKCYLIERNLNHLALLLKNKSEPAWAQKAKMTQLELISELCSLIENYFYYRNAVRTTPKNVFRTIVRNQTNTAWDESKRLSQIMRTEILHEFEFPKTKPSQITTNDWKILRGITKSQLAFHKSNQSTLAKFWRENQPVYNIFKHGMTIRIVMEPKTAGQPLRIYLRGFKNNRDKKVRTFVIECSEDMLKKYDELRKIVHCEYHFLMQTAQLVMTNKKVPIFPPVYNIQTNTAARLQSILKKMPFGKANIKVKLTMSFASQAAERLKKRENWVTIFNRDLLYRKPKKSELFLNGRPLAKQE